MNQPQFTSQDLQMIESIMQEAEIDYLVRKKKGQIDAVFNLAGRIAAIQMVFAVSRPYLHFQCICGMTIDPEDSELIQEMELYQGHINSIMDDFRFVTDHNTGQICLSRTIFCGDDPLKELLLLEMIMKGAELYLWYSQGIYSILFDGASAQEALTVCLGEILEKINRRLSAQQRLIQQKQKLERTLQDEHTPQVNLHPELLRVISERKRQNWAAEFPAASEEETPPLFREDDEES